MAIYLQNARIDFQMNGKQQVELRSLYLSVTRAMCIRKIRTLYSKNQQFCNTYENMFTKSVFERHT